MGFAIGTAVVAILVRPAVGSPVRVGRVVGGWESSGEADTGQQDKGEGN